MTIYFDLDEKLVILHVYSLKEWYQAQKDVTIRILGFKIQREETKQVNEHSIMQNTIAKDMLREYVKRNEVVSQAFVDFVEVAIAFNSECG